MNSMVRITGRPFVILELCGPWTLNKLHETKEQAIYARNSYLLKESR